MRIEWAYFCFCTFIFITLTGAEDTILGDFFKFHSEPDLLSPKPVVSIRTSNDSQLHPGYFFVTPSGHFDNDYWYSFGPHIYDNNGDLIWSGQDLRHTWQAPWGPALWLVLNLRVCDLWDNTGINLCWSEAAMSPDRIEGINRIFNQSYDQVVGDFTDFDRPERLNTHEFHTVVGGTSLVQQLMEKTSVDLSGYAGPKDGWIKDSCFEDVDIWSRTANFHWCLSQHAQLDDSEIYLEVPENLDQHVNFTSHIAGNGTYDHAWDYAHANAIDVTDEGDYLVSIRHFDQIIKLAGRNNPHGLEPGAVMWRLGGKRSDFMIEPRAIFSRQHQPTSLRISYDEEDLLLFDNAWEGVNPSSADHSSAKILRINNNTNEAVLVSEYIHPQRLKSESEGNTQRLSNGNVIIGWGFVPHTSEFSQEGEVLLHLEFSPLAKRGDAAYARSYRSYKFDWIGLPRWPPKLLAYRQNCTSPIYAYASWNGATGVHSWRFSVSDDEGSTWSAVSTVPRDGFETMVKIDLPDLAGHYVSVEALDLHNDVLSQKVVQQTWIPSQQSQDTLQSQCDYKGCTNDSTPSARFNYPNDLRNSTLCAVTRQKVHLNVNIILHPWLLVSGTCLISLLIIRKYTKFHPFQWIWNWRSSSWGQYQKLGQSEHELIRPPSLVNDQEEVHS